MALARGRINPLNVLGLRRLNTIPPHFGTLTIYNIDDVEKINYWIYYNLNSRYCIKIQQGLNENRQITDLCEIGVEDPKELTMLSLACPYLDNKN